MNLAAQEGGRYRSIWIRSLIACPSRCPSPVGWAVRDGHSCSMRERPSGAARAPRDERLDPYRGRDAHLTNPQGERAGELFVDVEDFTIQVGGHLWWRRWSSPTEMLHGWIGLTDGTTTDFLIFDGLDEALAEWATGTVDLYGTQYTVRWLDDHGSQLLRDQYQPTQAAPHPGHTP